MGATSAATTVGRAIVPELCEPEGVVEGMAYITGSALWIVKRWVLVPLVTVIYAAPGPNRDSQCLCSRPTGTSHMSGRTWAKDFPYAPGRWFDAVAYIDVALPRYSQGVFDSEYERHDEQSISLSFVDSLSIWRMKNRLSIVYDVGWAAVLLTWHNLVFSWSSGSRMYPP